MTQNLSLETRFNPMYENAFKNIEKTLRAEAGIANELDYVEQISWVLFLKYLDDLEGERRDRAELEVQDYTPILTGHLRWDSYWRRFDGRLSKLWDSAHWVDWWNSAYKSRNVSIE